MNIGDPVEKVGGDYTFAGTIVAKFPKLSGAVRFVVEDDRGVLHVYSEKNLRPRAIGPGDGVKFAPDGLPVPRYDMAGRRLTRCQSDDDGDCDWAACPQDRDGELKRSGRHCPLDRHEDNEKD